jgi:hypothetical protein
MKRGRPFPPGACRTGPSPPSAPAIWARPRQARFRGEIGGGGNIVARNWDSGFGWAFGHGPTPNRGARGPAKPFCQYSRALAAWR